MLTQVMAGCGLRSGAAFLVETVLARTARKRWRPVRDKPSIVTSRLGKILASASTWIVSKLHNA